MKNNITRRDFLNGVALGTGASMLAPLELLAQDASAAATNYYPPTLTGLRGSHVGSFEVMHALAWGGAKPESYRELGEHYDLVVVGAGVSGLAAARFWQKRMGEDAKILLLDNHDDFGGHAKRNEFHHDGQMLMSIGGAVNLEAPTNYSKIASGLLDDLGIDLDAMRANMSPGWGIGGSESIMTMPGDDGRVNVRANWSLAMLGSGDFESAVRELPLPAQERDKLVEFLGGHDYLEDLSLGDRYAYIQSTPYVEFLTEKVGFAPSTISIFFPIPIILFGAAVPRLTVLEAFYIGCSGVQGMGWLGQTAADLMTSSMDDYEALYFPDGNSSATRLLVNKLIPGVAPDGTGFDNVAVARFDYGNLDRSGNAVRLRLNSTAVGVREADGTVAVDYVQDGNAVSVTSDHCIMACYNSVIPYICPQLPESQKEALLYPEKVPLVWNNVVLNNGRALAKLGSSQFLCPNDPNAVITTAPHTVTGGNQPPQSPDAPVVLFMMTAPMVETDGSDTNRDLWLKARHQLYTKPFAAYEQEIRDQLQEILGKHGFNHETDIAAITVNRWPHGYAHEYMTLDDGPWEQGQAPHELGRAQFGRISIANSDSEARAYLDAAIDAAWRAVAEQASG